MFKQKYTWQKNVRALTVRAVKLSGEDEEEQMSFFAEEVKDEKRERVQKAAYDLENRFGAGAITFGSLMNNDKLPVKGHEDEEE